MDLPSLLTVVARAACFPQQLRQQAGLVLDRRAHLVKEEEEELQAEFGIEQNDNDEDEGVDLEDEDSGSADKKIKKEEIDDKEKVSYEN